MAACIDELLLETTESEVAFREGERRVRRLVELDPANLPGRTMQVLTITRRGTLEGLKLSSLPARPLQPDEILVDVAASGLNFRDVLNVLGIYPGQPALGAECTGTVRQVGRAVMDFQIGDPVAVVAPNTCCNPLIVPAELAVRIPSTLSLAEAATIPIAFLTAWYALEETADLCAGQRVLIHSAAGGVGHAAIQIARAREAEIFATASDAKQDYLRANLNLNFIYSSRNRGFAEAILQDTKRQGVDVLLNTLGDEFVDENLKALADNGIYVDLSKPQPGIHEQIARQRPDVRYIAVDLVHYLEVQPRRIRSHLGELFHRLETRGLTPIPKVEYPLDSAVDAFRLLQSAKHIGKVLLIPNAPAHPKSSSQPGIRSDSAYVISGGMGGLGLQIAESLARRGTTQVVLLGRHQPTPAQLQRIRQIEAFNCRITTMRCDVSQFDEVSHTLDRIRKTIGPIAGVIHSAGVLSDAGVMNQSPETFGQVFDPKVRGAWNLHLATLNDPLDEFVLFSSIAGYLGSPGQVNHAAANTFLDALAAYRHQRNLPALSIAWGPWSEVGAAIQNGKVQHPQASAFGWIAPAEGVEGFQHALEHSNPTSIAIMKFDPARLTGDLRNRSIFQSLLHQPTAQPKRELSPNLALLKTLPPGEASQTLMIHLKRKIAEILCLDGPEQVPIDMALFDLGLDSLTTLELKGALEAGLGIPLHSSVFFDYPTLSGLCSYLLTKIQHQQDTEPEEVSSPNATSRNGIQPPRQDEASTEVDSDVEDQETREKLMEIARELQKWDDIYSG